MISFVNYDVKEMLVGKLTEVGTGELIIDELLSFLVLLK